MTWQVGDLAVCVDRKVIECPTAIHLGGYAPTACGPLAVVSVVRKRECRCIVLVLENGSRGIAPRFRKVIHDKKEACETEFVTLLKRKPVEVVL